MPRHEPQFGRAFEVSDVQVIDAQTRREVEHTRTIVVYAILAASCVALLWAAGLGTWDGSFDELQKVYNVVVIFLSAVVGYYLPHRRQDE